MGGRLTRMLTRSGAPSQGPRRSRLMLHPEQQTCGVSWKPGGTTANATPSSQSSPAAPHGLRGTQVQDWHTWSAETHEASVPRKGYCAQSVCLQRQDHEDLSWEWLLDLKSLPKNNAWWSYTFRYFNYGLHGTVKKEQNCTSLNKLSTMLRIWFWNFTWIIRIRPAGLLLSYFNSIRFSWVLSQPCSICRGHDHNPLVLSDCPSWSGLLLSAEKAWAWGPVKTQVRATQRFPSTFQTF